MEIKEIIQLIETRFLPLIDNIKSPLSFRFGEVNLTIHPSYIHVFYKVFSSSQFDCTSNKDWTSVSVCPNHITQDDLLVVHDSLIDIWENNLKGSKIIMTRKEQLTNRMKEIQNELSLCQ
ncbi:hypothetical protein SAMN05421877_11917 [Sphingobacterium lactis]|uniref:Uncharacterized protein n=1 Tax=Sphingobacterium lactis TaxID=797291 RepID=A0A1H6CR60_9SPHI|nr:hypothetical protein SAMN05421877_11917 [Sphingobacterium lactis]